MQFAFNKLKLDRIVSIAPKTNLNSIQIMRKIAMNKVADFKHSQLKEYEDLVDCVYYEIKPNKGI